MTAGTCPAGCGRNQLPGKFLCRRCWFEVPLFLRDALIRAWRAYSKSSPRNDPEFPAKSRAYRAARDNCLASIK